MLSPSNSEGLYLYRCSGSRKWHIFFKSTWGESKAKHFNFSGLFSQQKRLSIKVIGRPSETIDSLPLFMHIRRFYLKATGRLSHMTGWPPLFLHRRSHCVKTTCRFVLLYRTLSLYVKMTVHQWKMIGQLQAAKIMRRKLNCFLRFHLFRTHIQL